MNVYTCLTLLVFVAGTAYATEFSEEDVRMFLPFLANLKPPPACPPNELYRSCMGNCSDCTNRGQCFIERCIEGCDCAPRFYRVEPGGPCLPVAKCPIPECGENEVFRACGPVCERCTTFRCRVIGCDHKCYCKEGYLRNNEGKCVPEKECPKKKRCSATEQWAESGPTDEFCLLGNSTDLGLTQKIEQCYCKSGYKRNCLGFCIREEMCANLKCLGVEIYHDCVPKCNTTCGNYGNPDCVEDDNCYPGCFCAPGYVMNDFRACIPIEECKPDADTIVVVSNGDYEAPSDEETTPTAVSDESTIKESNTEVPRNCETTDEDGRCTDVLVETSTNLDENTDPSSENTATTLLIETTSKPTTAPSTTRTNDQSSKPRRKMKTSKPSKYANAAASAASSKQQRAADDYNAEF